MLSHMKHISEMTNDVCFDEDEDIHPVSKEAAADAEILLRLLPVDVELPIVESIGDGTLSFIWYTKDMIGGLRMVGEGNILFYLRKPDHSVQMKSFTLRDENAVIASVREIRQAYTSSRSPDSKTGGLTESSDPKEARRLAGTVSSACPFSP